MADTRLLCLKLLENLSVRAGQSIVPVHEHFPSSRDWGKSGWSFQDKEPADAKFDRLLKRQKYRA